MDKNLLMTRIAAIVTSIEGGTPESMLYIFCDMNMEEYNIVRDVLVRADLVSIKGHYVTLTENGKVTAAKLNAVISKGN